MNTTIQTQTPAEFHFEAQERTLKELAAATSALHTVLGRVAADATRIQDKLEKGYGIRALGHNSPLDRQAIDEVAVLSGRVNALLDTAQLLNIENQRIEAAYKIA